AGPEAGPDAGLAESPPAPAEQRVHAVANRDLLAAQILRPQWWLLPLAIAVPILYFTFGHDLSFIPVASTVTAVIGAIQAPVRSLLAEWNFVVAVAPDGLRLHRGLLETRSQTVPPGRVQVVAVERPLLWRAFGWVRATMHIAGVSHREPSERAAGLLPV